MLYIKFIHKFGAITLLLINLFAVASGAQDPERDNFKKNGFPVQYRSEADEKIVLKNLTLAPVYDNVNGIYAKPIQKLLSELLQNDKSWGFTPFPEIKKKYFIEEFESKPELVQEILNQSSTNGLISAIITKGPNGLNAKIQLFTQDKGKLLAEEEYSDPTVFEIKHLREQFVKMYLALKNKMPYRGFILSRRGLEVTINMGSYNGVKPDHELIAAQILKIKRHPKLSYMVGVEKEIIGKIKIVKVEPYLSFGTIIFEKESGVLEPGAKILPSSFIAYPIPKLNADGEVKEELIAENNLKSPSEVTDVSSPPPIVQFENEWDPFYERDDSFGFISAQLALGQYSQNDKRVTGGGINGSNGFAPGFDVAFQYYYLKNSFAKFNSQQHIFNIDNPLTGSTPSSLNFTYSYYQLGFGYDFYLHTFMRGLRISPALIYTTVNTKPTASNSVAYTGTNTDGAGVQIQTALPLAKGFFITEVGMNIDIVLFPKIQESPLTSGDSKASLNGINFYGLVPFSDTMRFRAEIGLTSVNANFSGRTNRSPAISSSNLQMISESFGIDYLF